MKLNLIERFFLRRIQEKASRTDQLIVTGIPGGEVWPNRNYENFAKETYMKNWIAFRCIDAIAKAVASVPWEVYQRIDAETKESVEDHPLNKILKRANPRLSFTSLTYSAISYMCMAGNAYIEKVSPETGPNKGLPMELYSHRPDRMRIKTSELTGQISGYIYSVNGGSTTFDVDPISGRCDIMHLKSFHPLDDFFGMSAAEPGAISIDGHNSSSMWNKKLTENEARPGAVFVFKQQLQDKQFKSLKKQITENREGAQFAGKSLIVEGGCDIKPYGFTPLEMDWLKSNIELARAICNVWGVPGQMIGIPDTATYANYKEAREAFWEETVLYYLKYYKDELNYWLLPEDLNSEKIFIDYCLDEVPAFAGQREAVWTRVSGADFLKVDEKREAVDYPKLENNIGQVVLVSSSMIPLDLGAEDGGEESTPADEEDTTNEDGLTEDEEDAVQKLIVTGLTREEAILAIGVKG